MLKNREMLAVGAKPAPGDLAYVQGLLNLLRYLEMHKEIEGIWAIKRWFVRHGLISKALLLGESELNRIESFHKAMRGMINCNDRSHPDKKTIRLLNGLAKQTNLVVCFQPDGVPRFRPAVHGFDKALGILLAIVIESIKDGSWKRLKACSASECQWVYFDSSKNASGRWCQMSVCGGRAKSRAWRKRNAKRL